MSVKVNPPPQIRIPDKFFDDPETRSFFEQQQLILFQLWNRTGGNTDLVSDLEQIPVIGISSDRTLSPDDLGSLIVVDTSDGNVNLTMPNISSDDIGKSIIVVIIDATNDCFVYSNGSDLILGDNSVLMNDQFLSVHFTSISITDWIAQ